MPKGSTQYRLNAIKAENAEATIEEYNYDDCVRKAAAESAKRPHSVVIQDTAWEGYEKIPSWIMQGYGTMALESSEQFGERPTHILFKQVSEACRWHSWIFTNKYKDNPPIMVVVETSVADCLYKSAVKIQVRQLLLVGKWIV